MSIRPRARPEGEEFKVPATPNGASNDAPASGGKGGGKSVNPRAKKGSADYRKMQKANAPDSFYGYYDRNTGDYVPWYIDMINGGGANTAGPTFKGGVSYGRIAGGLLNAAGVSPYGQDRPREFMPESAYRGGDVAPSAPAPSVAPAPSRGVIDEVLRPRARPAFPSRSNVEPIGPYAMVPMAQSGIGADVVPEAFYSTASAQPAPSPSDTAFTTPGMDFLMNMAQNTVMQKFPDMPRQEQQMLIDQEYQKIAQTLGY